MLDGDGLGNILVNFKENEDGIEVCSYTGHRMQEILNKIRNTGLLEVSVKDWRIFRRLSTLVDYTDYDRVVSLILNSEVEIKTGRSIG